jgi:predicted Ser/Thr protein kinase
MDKYCPSEATKRQFGHDKKVKQLTHNKSIGKIGDVKQKEAEENLLRKFLGQKGDRKSVAEEKPKGYVSPYAETTEIKPLEEKPKGYVSPYEEPAKTTETVDKEKPKGYVSPYDEQPLQLLAKSSDKNVKKQDTGHQIGDEVKKLFGGVEKLLHINDHKDSKKKDEKKKEEKKEEKKK